MLLEGLLLLILLKTFESSKFFSVFETLDNDASMAPDDEAGDEAGDVEVGGCDGGGDIMGSRLGESRQKMVVHRNGSFPIEFWEHLPDQHVDFPLVCPRVHNV